MTWTLVLVFHICCSGNSSTAVINGFKTQQACALEAQRITKINPSSAGSYCVRVS